MKIFSNFSKSKKISLAILQVILVSGFYSTFLYLNNIIEVHFHEYFMITIQQVLIGTIILILFGSILRNINEAVFMTSITMLIYTNFFLIETVLKFVFPFLRYWQMLIIAITFIIVLTIVLFRTIAKILKEINQLIIVIISGLIVLNIITNIGGILQSFNSAIITKQDEMLSYQENDSPNIYYLVFDEYASNAFMLKYFNYDNSSFTNWLENKGFDVSYSSHSSHHETIVVMTNNVNLDYVMNSNDPQEAQQKRINNKLFEILRQHNYGIQVVGLSSFYGMPDPLNNNETRQGGSKTNDGLTFRELILKNTPFYISVISQNLNQHRQNIENCLAFMKNKNNFPEWGMFTLMHIELPHAPFIYDENGNEVPAGHMNDWANKQYYLNQYIYTTKQMQDLIETLLKNDPNSIILLTSDHSARAFQDVETEDKKQCFLAYYNRSWEGNIEGESVINVLRQLLNQLFEMDMKMVEMQ